MIRPTNHKITALKSETCSTYGVIFLWLCASTFLDLVIASWANVHYTGTFHNVLSKLDEMECVVKRLLPNILFKDKRIKIGMHV